MRTLYLHFSPHVQRLKQCICTFVYRINVFFTAILHIFYSYSNFENNIMEYKLCIIENLRKLPLRSIQYLFILTKLRNKYKYCADLIYESIKTKEVRRIVPVIIQLNLSQLMMIENLTPRKTL